MRRVCTGLVIFTAALGAAVAVPGTFAATSTPAATTGEPTPSYVLPYRMHAPADAALEATMLVLVNQSRDAAGLTPLAVNPTLRTIARHQGAEMFAFGYLSHQSRDGRLPLARVEAAGLTSWHVGENLAYAADVREAHRLLMNSPEHRENILSPIYRWVGIGVKDSGRHGVIVVEDFTD